MGHPRFKTIADIKERCLRHPRLFLFWRQWDIVVTPVELGVAFGLKCSTSQWAPMTMIITLAPIIVATEFVQPALMPASSDGENQARHACVKQGFHRDSPHFFRIHRRVHDVCATRGNAAANDSQALMWRPWLAQTLWACDRGVNCAPGAQTANRRTVFPAARGVCRRVPHPSAVPKRGAVAVSEKDLKYPTLAQNARMGHPLTYWVGHPPDIKERCLRHPRKMRPSADGSAPPARCLLLPWHVGRLRLLLPPRSDVVAHMFINNTAMDRAIDPDYPLHASWLARNLLAPEHHVLQHRLNIGTFQTARLPGFVFHLAEVFSHPPQLVATVDSRSELTVGSWSCAHAQARGQKEH